MKNRCTKEKENKKNNSDFMKKQETGKRKKMRQKRQGIEKKGGK